MNHNISEKMYGLTQKNSAIRMMFEEGNRLAEIYGRENVYDFSLGNPCFPAPDSFNQAIKDVLDEVPSTYVHGYMPNSGYPEVREAVANSINKRFGTSYNSGNIIMTVGAAGALNISLKALLNPGDEVMVLAPYFLEYGNYVANYDAKLVVVPANTQGFLPDPAAIENAITERTKALIINTPNNPTGVIYSEDTIRSIAEVLEKKSAELGHPIYMVSDEPYRELAYDGAIVPWVPNYYANTLVCYSWSKSMSLPGERIGYVVIPSQAQDASLIFDAVSIANRICGFVNAPGLMQLAIARCLDDGTDISNYDANRKLLYQGLTDLGFECVYPDGAFYMWGKNSL